MISNPDFAADVDAIRALAEQAETAFNTGDADALMDVFAEDCLRLPPDEPAIAGKEPNLAWFKGLLDQFSGTVKFLPEQLEVAGDWAFGWGNYSMTITPKAGGETITENGKYLDIYRRQSDGSWKYAIHMFNSSEPAGEC